MDDTYAINLAKTEFREGFNTGDVERVLSVFCDQCIDMSEGKPSFYGSEAKDALRARFRNLLNRYGVELAVVVGQIFITGKLAVDWGWHHFTLCPKNGDEPVKKRERYLEMWAKEPDGKWRIAIFINNADQTPQMHEPVST